MFPDPLHPAVVHFPIVFILLGAVAAIAAVFWRKWNLPWLATGLLVLGFAGAVVAVRTGEAEGELAGEAPAAAGLLIDQHETWAQRTQVAAGLAGLVALAAAVLVRREMIRRIVAATAALGALTASWCVYETGHRGGRLVYQHGVGVLANGPAADPGGEKSPAPEVSVSQRDDDD